MATFAYSFDELYAHACAEKRPWFQLRVEPVSDFLIGYAASQGISLDGYVYQIQATRLRHAIRRHGEANHERDRGQVALTEWHLRKIPEILASPHRVEKAPSHVAGLHAFKLARDYSVDGSGQLVVEEMVVKGKIKLLNFKTLYWFRPG